MRTQKEVQDWLNKIPLRPSDFDAIKKWLDIYFDNNNFIYLVTKLDYDGVTLQDIIDFVNSPSPIKDDFSPIVAQFEKVRKEMNKLEKLINKIR